MSFLTLQDLWYHSKGRTPSTATRPSYMFSSTHGPQVDQRTHAKDILCCLWKTYSDSVSREIFSALEATRSASSNSDEELADCVSKDTTITKQQIDLATRMMLEQVSRLSDGDYEQSMAIQLFLDSALRLLIVLRHTRPRSLQSRATDACTKRCTMCPSWNGLGSRFLCNAYKRVLEGGAAIRPVFIPKSSTVDDNGLIVRPPDALRPLALYDCDCEIITTAICPGLHWNPGLRRSCNNAISCICFVPGADHGFQ